MFVEPAMAKATCPVLKQMLGVIQFPALAFFESNGAMVLQFTW